MYVHLSDEAEAMIEDLRACGTHGVDLQEVATTLILDQLKFLMGTIGFADLFERKRRERKAADAVILIEPVPAPSPERGCLCGPNGVHRSVCPLHWDEAIPF